MGNNELQNNLFFKLKVVGRDENLLISVSDFNYNTTSGCSTLSHDNSYVFYVKCGSIKRTFTYIFTGTKTYNTNVFSASKHTKLTYRRHLKMNPYEY